MTGGEWVKTPRLRVRRQLDLWLDAGLDRRDGAGDLPRSAGWLTHANGWRSA
jgi:hypothetical protein